MVVIFGVKNELYSMQLLPADNSLPTSTGVSITLNAYSLSCVIKNCKRPKIYLATTLTTTCTNNAINSIASILLFTELHVE